MIKTKIIGLVTSLVLFGVMPSQASTLVDQGNNTYDPNTKLLWLDVTLTTNRSYNDVIANLNNPADVVYGYRYATAAELSQLFTDAGIPNGEVAAVESLILLLGNTSVFEELIYTQGIIGDPYSWEPDYYAQRGLLLLINNSWAASSNNGGVPKSQYSSNTGSFLVATPLPAALPLFATGLGALGLLGWRRKRKASAAA
jgi:hypothetical protein